MTARVTLLQLGWRPFFEAQLDGDANVRVARIMTVQRGRIEVAHDGGQSAIALHGKSAALGVTVGDWVKIDADGANVLERLEPFSVFKRRAAGTGAAVQAIAANVDTVFIVTSANREFNVARLERYLAIAHEAGTYPLIVITKVDLAIDAGDFASAAAKLAPNLHVEMVDSRDERDVSGLRSYCVAGQTVALLGSSGVGKSTIINTLTGNDQSTFASREDDQRGRHTTTSRSMHAIANGGWLIDTPGMRELQLIDVGDALDDVFADVAALASDCRFVDCDHNGEPGCAVQEAIEQGTLDADRLRRFKKLSAEDRRNSETLADRRHRDKSQGKLYKNVQSEKQQRKRSGH